MRVWFFKKIFLATLLFALVSCNKSPSYSKVSSASLNSSFSAIKATILDVKCSKCHSPTRPEGGVSLSSYDDVMSSPGTVIPFQPHQSQLFWQCYKGYMPEREPALSALELQTLYDWISNGAPNN
ncbi:hypothetical protein EBT16_03410 [bacterium]|nr:hypothetical protein [bacterium]